MAARFSKWIGYEFATKINDIDQEDLRNIDFPNGFIQGSASGYLMDIVKIGNVNAYKIELRYKNSNFKNESQIMTISYNFFKHWFYDVTALPK